MAGFPSKEKGTRIGNTAKQPHPGIALDKNVIKELIIKHYGNLSRVADAMGSTRHTIRRHCDNDTELLDCLNTARERNIDELEESVWDRAKAGHDTGLQCFLLKTQARHRGYDQDEAKNQARDIATAAFNFIIDKQPKTTS